MPIVKDLEEINQVHCDLLDEVLSELVLIYVKVNVFNFFVLSLELQQKALMLMKFFLVQCKYNLADFCAEMSGLLRVKII